MASKRSAPAHAPWKILLAFVAVVIAYTGFVSAVPDTRHALYHIDSTMVGRGETEVCTNVTPNCESHSCRLAAYNSDSFLM